MRLKHLVTVALFGVLTNSVLAEPGTWTPVPTPNAARIRKVGYLLGPDQPLYAAAETELYVSTDGGARWTPIGGAVGNLFSFDPASRVIYVADPTTDYIRQSMDAGQTWSEPTFAGREGGRIEALACDPARPQRLWLGRSEGGLFRSDNSGSSWNPTDLSGIQEKPFFVQTIFVHSIPGLLLVGAKHKGLFRSTDDGLSWSQPSGIPPKGTVTSLASSPADPMTVYCGTAGGGVFKSTNGGLSWDAVQPRLANVMVNDLSVDRSDSRRLYAAVSGSVYGGIYRSTDGAASWRRLISEVGSDEAFSVGIDPNDSKVVYAGALGVEKSTDGGEEWVSCTLGISGSDLSGFCVSDGQLLYAWSDNALFKATESGSWTRIAHDFVRSFIVGFDRGPELLVATADGMVLISGDEGYTWLEHSTGLQGLSCLAADPHLPGAYYAAGSGVVRSIDGGKTWSPLACPDDFGIKRLVVDPRIPGRLYALSAREFAPAYRTTDGGRLWSACSPYETVDLEVDPFTANRLYAIHGTQGPYISTDDGVTWQRSVGGMQDQYIGLNYVVVDPNQSGRICVLGSVSMFLSSNAGASWEKLDIEARFSPWWRPQFAADPARLFLGNHRTVWVRTLDASPLPSPSAHSSWLDGAGALLPDTHLTCPDRQPATSSVSAQSPRPQSVTPAGAAILSVAESRVDPNRLAAISSLGRLYLSKDAGVSWNPAVWNPAVLTNVSSIAFHPTDVDTFYVACGPVLRTSDFGRTWSAGGGGPVSSKSVQLDPRDPESIWAFGEDVWRSTDAGETWHLVNTFNFYSRLSACGLLPEAEPGTIYRLANNGVMKSTDDGRHWSPVGACDAVQYLVHPANANIHYQASSIYGLLGSTDGGRTWAALNAGLPDIGASSVVSSPTDPGVLFIATPGSPAGCFASTDGGRSWKPKPSDSSQVYALALSPLTGALYAGTREGVRVSFNQGDEWRPINSGIEEMLSGGMVTASNDGALYLGSHRGLLRSRDAGATWSAIYSGPQPVSDPMHVIGEGDVAIHPGDPRLIYLILENGREMRRSDDGGDRWVKVWDDYDTNLRTIAFDPVNTDVVYAGSGAGGLTFIKSTDRGGTWHRQEPKTSLGRLLTGNRPGSLYGIGHLMRVSLDYGDTWNLLPCPVEALKLAIDPWDDRYLFAVGQTEAYTSTDGGTTWTRLELPANLRGKYWGVAYIYDVAIDPKNPSRVFLAREDGVFVSWNRGVSWSVRLADFDHGRIRITLVDAWDNRWLVTLSINQDLQYPYWAAVHRFPLVPQRRRGRSGRNEMEY